MCGLGMGQRFDAIKSLVRRRAGIVLEGSQDYLIEARLEPLAVRLGLAKVANLEQQLMGVPTEDLQRQVVEAMTTHETSFFRDPVAFDVLRTKVLPALLTKRSAVKRLRIWSAACSTGQEPYSLAMLLDDAFPELASWAVTIHATDLSGAVLDVARQGRFQSIEVARGLPQRLQQKYFTQEGDRWIISPIVRAKIVFKQLNLIENFPPGLPPFDIIFCRNVLIYFDATTRETILRKLRRQMATDGMLFVGTTETTATLNSTFKRSAFGQAGCFEPVA